MKTFLEREIDAKWPLTDPPFPGAEEARKLNLAYTRKRVQYAEDHEQPSAAELEDRHGG